MKKVMLMIYGLTIAYCTNAASVTTNGYTWTYSVSNGGAVLTGTSSTSPAISPTPSGTLEIPSTLGSYQVTGIGYCAFYGCRGLTNVTIPDSVTSIGESAFSGCSGLTSVTIPDSVTSIGYSAFSGCSGLEEITLPFVGARRGYTGSSDSPFGYIFGQSSYAGGTKTTQLYSSSASSSVAFYIPSKLRKVVVTDETVLGYGAFYGCSGLTSVTIPDSVTSIGDYAFSGCSGLTSVTIPDSVTSIGGYAFSGCSGLEEITLPFVGARRGNTGSSDSPFGYIFGQSSYAGGTKTTQYWSWSSSSHSDYYVPSKLEKVVITDETVLGYGAFSGCSGLTSVTIPDSVTNIVRDAFTGCNMKLFDSETISGVTMVDGWIVGYESGLSGVLELTGVRGIGGAAFSGCSGLTSVTIPDSVTSIGSSAFSGCSGLTSVTIPDSVTSIGESAFSGCSGLTSVTIPDSVTSIGSSAFSGCSGLEEITLPFVGARRGNTGSSDFLFGHIFGQLSYAGGTKTKQYWSSSANLDYYVPSKLRKVVITDETVLGYGAFYGCRRLTSVTIPDGVTSIGQSAFYGCSGLTSMSIPSVVVSIGSYAFAGCTGIRDVTIPQCICATNMLTTFPAAYQFITNAVLTDGVTSISEKCFSGCEALQTVKLPASLTRIHEKAFDGCIGLESVRFQGDAPDVDSAIYFGTPRSLLTYVPEGSKGWSGGVSSELPETWPVGDATARAIAYWDGPDENVTRTPVIVPYGGTLFTNSCEVSISCATEGATIYYTTNGSTPRASARYAYSSPFRVSDTTTIKAVAVADGLENSDYVTVVLKKVDAYTLPLALGTPIGVNITTSEGAEWFPTGDYASPTNGLASRSGQIPAESETWIDAVINGAGTFTFWWRVSCEEDPDGTCSWDHLSCDVDGEHYASIDGITGWERRDIVFDEAKEHSVRWTFAKDDFDEDEAGYEDCAWLAGLSWKPTAVLVPSSMTGGRSIVVEKTWSERYPLFDSLYGPDFAAAVTNATGKFSSAGEPMFVWHDYLMGTDPTDIDDRLLAHITFRRRQPVISWTPNLNTNGEVRVYKVFGKTNLTDSAWSYPKNNGHRFFKVKVEMP